VSLGGDDKQDGGHRAAGETDPEGPLLEVGRRLHANGDEVRRQGDRRARDATKNAVARGEPVGGATGADDAAGSA